MLGRILDALHTNLSVRFLDVRLLVAGDFGGRGLLTLDRERHAAFLGNPLAAHPSQGEFFRVVASERVCAVRGNVAANIRVRSNGDLAGIAIGRVAFYLADREGVFLKIICFLRVIGRFCAALDRNQTGFLEVAFTGLDRLIGGWGLRLPDRVEVGDLGGCCNRIAAFDRDSRIVRIPIPAEEFVAVSSWLLAGNGERHLAGVGLFSLRSRYTIFIAAVGVVVQGVGDLRVGILRNQIDRRALVASRRVFQVEAPSLRVRICFLAPANDLIAAVHSCSVRSCLDIADGDRVVVVGRVAVIRRVLAYKLRVFRCTVIVADTELIADIKNGESYIDLMAGIQCLRTDTVVSC